MSMLQHDSQGFLIGEKLLDAQLEMLRRQQTEIELLRSIDASLMGRRSRRPSRAARPPNTQPAQLPTISPAGRSSPLTRTPGSSRTVLPTVTPQRDAEGRFIGKGRVSTPGGPEPESGGRSPEAPGRPPRTPKSDDESTVKEMAKSVRDLAFSVADNLDPTIQATKEIKETLSPIGRGFKAVFGDPKDKKKERWYKRILAAITGMRTEPSGFGSSSSADDEGGLGAAAMGMVGRILPALGAILGPVLLVVMAGLAGLGIGKLISDWMDSSGATTKLLDAIDSMKQTWTDLKGWFGDKFGKAKEAVAKAVDAGVSVVKERTGIDVSGAGSAIKRVLGINGTERVVEKGDGSIESRNGGSVSWRNQNPGNLKFEYANSADKTVKSKRTKEEALKAAQAK